jgi:hypothetical protein
MISPLPLRLRTNRVCLARQLRECAQAARPPLSGAARHQAAYGNSDEPQRGSFGRAQAQRAGAHI